MEKEEDGKNHKLNAQNAFPVGISKCLSQKSTGNADY
jgi:hypothetical protein